MMSLSSTIKKQRHHAERAIWYIAYDFKKEKQNQPEGETEETDMKGYTFLNVE